VSAKPLPPLNEVVAELPLESPEPLVVDDTAPAPAPQPETNEASPPAPQSMPAPEDAPPPPVGQ
jgi:monofunctional glycosyltransferase